MKDRQLNNYPGGEIKEKTRWSSNCYPQRAKLKLQGIEFFNFLLLLTAAVKGDTFEEEKHVPVK